MGAGSKPRRIRLIPESGQDYNLASLMTRTSSAQPEWAHGLGAPTVVLKLGGDGCLVSQHGQQHHIPGHRVPLVDATGAGDCFCGNLLARLAAGDALVDAARYANAAAALAVQGFGAVAPLPRPAQVHAVS